MDIMSALSAGTKALEALKAIQEIGKSYDAATWKAKVAELMSDVADMKMALVEANDKISELERQTHVLSAQVTFKAEKTVSKNGFLYEVLDGGEIAEFPFCQNCTTNGKFVRIVRGAIQQRTLSGVQDALRHTKRDAPLTTATLLILHTQKRHQPTAHLGNYLDDLHHKR